MFSGAFVFVRNNSGLKQYMQSAPPRIKLDTAASVTAAEQALKILRNNILIPCYQDVELLRQQPPPMLLSTIDTHIRERGHRQNQLAK